MHEITYVADASLRRKAVLDWLWQENAGLFFYGSVVVISVLVMVFSVNLRLPAAAVFGFSLAYFIWSAQQTAVSARQELQGIGMRLNEDGVIWYSPDVESICRWSSVRSLSLTRRFVFVVVHERPIAVPRAAFTDEALAFLIAAAQAAGAKVRGI